MTEERKAALDRQRDHRSEAEKALFRVIQDFSAKETITATDANALAAVTEALISVQKMGCY